MVHLPDTPRKEVLQSDCWDLSPMFKSTKLWETCFQALEKKLSMYDDFKGTLAKGADALLACIEFDHGVGREMDILYTFAHLKNDEDKTHPDNEGLFQRASNLYARIGEASSFISPEIQAIPLDQLTIFLDKEAFKPYRFYLKQIIRYIPHTRSAESEQLLAMVGESLGAPKKIFSQLDNADLNFGTVKNPLGDKFALTHGNFITFIGNKDRNFRKTVFDQYYRTYHDHRHTIAATLASSVKKDLFWAKARHFNSARQAALFANNVPEDVYDNLIVNVKKAFPCLYRYLDFRKQVLGVDQLHMYDTYVRLVPDIDFHMNYEQAVTLECLRIPHFYSSFYVYKYATGLAAALGLAQQITDKGKQAVDDYLCFLKLGGSMFPIDELKTAGVDMASITPIQAVAAHFESQVIELETMWQSI